MRTILQVDDDPNDVFLLQHAMRKVGVTNPIHVLTDGREAIAYLRGAGQFADRARFPFPCLVLLDLKLPYVMGLDVLRWIRRQPRRALPVLLLTASGCEADIAEAYRLGANAFLTKPAEASKLETMVKAIKDFWLTHNTLPHEPSPQPPPQRAQWRAPGSHTGFAAKRRQQRNATRRRPRPRNHKKTHEKNHRISL